jgi:nitroreductase
VEALQAIHSRRTIRVYRPDPVDRALLAKVLWAAVQAPTPPVSGQSAWKLCVIEGAERLSAFGERARQYADEHQPPGRPWTWTTRAGFKVFWNAPAVVLFCAKSANPEAPYDCCRAAQNMLIAAHAVGLGTCWVGAPIPWLNSPGVPEELGIPEGYHASAAVLIGHPDEQPLGEPRPEPEVLWR